METNPYFVLSGSTKPQTTSTVEETQSLPSSPRVVVIDDDRKVALPSQETLLEFNILLSQCSRINITKQELCLEQATYRHSYPLYRTNKIVTSEEHPVTSLSIIPVYWNGTQYLYSLWQRRDTIEFTLLIRAMYRYEHLYRILYFITSRERERLLLYVDRFKLLWNDYRPISKGAFHEKQYSAANKAFTKLKKSLKQLLDLVQCNYSEAEWMFPRGRKESLLEADEETAKREFEEEVNISSAKLTKVPLAPMVEYYRGSDGIVYSTIYYIYEACEPLESPKVRTDSVVRPITISNDFCTQGWFSLEHTKEKLNTRRYTMLCELDTKLLELHKKPSKL